MAGSTVKTHDLSSGFMSNDVSFTHTYSLTITVPAGEDGPYAVVVDYLYPTESLGEWGDFQIRSSSSSYTYSFPQLQHAIEWLSGQWMRVTWWTPSGFSWASPVTFWVQYNFTGTRQQTLSGVSSDFKVAPGDYYTSPTTWVTAPPPVYAFADSCEAHEINGQVHGHYGTVLRVQGFLHSQYPGTCGPMSNMLAAAMRHLNIPACIAYGYMVPGSFRLPYAFGSYDPRVIPFSASEPHSWVGGWRDDGVFVPLDTVNRWAQFTALQTCMIGYFDDISDVVYRATPFGGGAGITATTSRTFSNASSSGSQTYTWTQTRLMQEAYANGAYELYCQKPSSSYAGGIVGGGGGTTGVPDDPPGIPTALAIFPATQRPVRPGERLYVEIGAPQEGTTASLRMYDVQGRMIPDFGFDGRSLSGYNVEYLQVPDSVGSGVYFVRLTFDGQVADTDRIIVVR